MGCGASANQQAPTVDPSKLSPQARLAEPLSVDTKSLLTPRILRKVEDSMAGVVPGPEEKAIAGTADSEFRPVLEQESSGISAELQACIEQLSTTVFGLPFSVSIAIPSITDTPLIGISDGFCELSGYRRDEVIGQNCRFLLKGVPKEEVSDSVRQEARRYCRAAHLRNLSSMAHSWLLQRNARKNGELFWNYFVMTMIPGPDKRTYIIGLQLDLGPTLVIPEGQKRPGEEIVAGHRKNLELVRGLMFGSKPAAQLSPNHGDIADTFLRLSQDITGWLSHAEMCSEAFQKWGTKPWVSWPERSKHALLNGGTTLLRLEADAEPAGALAMAIFPADKKANHRSFKIRIDEVCAGWERAVYKQGKLPTLGFTTITPAGMDEKGGLPVDVTTVPSSVLFFGDGSIQVANDLSGGEQNWCPESSALPSIPYEMVAEDTLECIWGKGFMRLEANGEELFNMKDCSIPAPPKKPVFGIIDLCYAACRVTLVA